MPLALDAFLKSLTRLLLGRHVLTERDHRAFFLDDVALKLDDRRLQHVFFGAYHLQGFREPRRALDDLQKHAPGECCVACRHGRVKVGYRSHLCSSRIRRRHFIGFTHVCRQLIVREVALHSLVTCLCGMNAVPVFFAVKRIYLRRRRVKVCTVFGRLILIRRLQRAWVSPHGAAYHRP